MSDEWKQEFVIQPRTLSEMAWQMFETIQYKPVGQWSRSPELEIGGEWYVLRLQKIPPPIGCIGRMSGHSDKQMLNDGESESPND